MKKLICLPLAFALMALLQARTDHTRTDPPAPTPPPFGDIKGAFFALSVADIEASANWYAEKLGLTVDMRSKSGKISVIVLSGNITLESARAAMRLPWLPCSVPA